MISSLTISSSTSLASPSLDQSCWDLPGVLSGSGNDWISGVERIRWLIQLRWRRVAAVVRSHCWSIQNLAFALTKAIYQSVTLQSALWAGYIPKQNELSFGSENLIRPRCDQVAWEIRWSDEKTWRGPGQNPYMTGNSTTSGFVPRWGQSRGHKKTERHYWISIPVHDSVISGYCKKSLRTIKPWFSAAPKECDGHIS